MDMSETISAKSDQLDYQNFLGGSQVVTVKEVRKGPSAEQPIEILTDEFERPWRPALSMRRVMVAAWGKDSQTYIGRNIELFGDPTVKWAGAAVGGIRIASLSHLEKPLTVALTVTRGKRAPFTVQPLKEPTPEPATEPWLAQWQAISNALNTAGYEGDGQALLATAGQVIGAEWSHPNQISPEDAQKILAAVREEAT